MNPYPFELVNHFTVPCTSCLLWQVTSSFYSWGGSETNRRHEHELRGVYQNGFPSQYSRTKKLPSPVHFYAKNRLKFVHR